VHLRPALRIIPRFSEILTREPPINRHLGNVTNLCRLLPALSARGQTPVQHAPLLNAERPAHILAPNRDQFDAALWLLSVTRRAAQIRPSYTSTIGLSGLEFFSL
jgi:hypothetical protein